MLDLYKLHVFSRVADAGSFSAAAERLYMTQPAVSQHIQDLEAALGVQLFQRGRRGVVLTPDGRVLQSYARRLLQLAAEAESVVTNPSALASGQIAIGATPGVSTYLLPRWMHEFSQHYPHLRVALHTATTPEIAAQLSAGKIDLGFIEGEIDDAQAGRLETQVVCEVPQLMLVGPKSELWRRERIVASELDGQAFVMRQPGSQSRRWLDHLLRERAVTPRIVAEFDNPEAIKRSVQAGASIAVLPKYAAMAELKRGTLHAVAVDIPLTRTLRAAWSAATPLPPIARAFMAHVDACVHDAD
jgi:DNA-binding transcriptional LysR family regulator